MINNQDSTGESHWNWNRSALFSCSYRWWWKNEFHSWVSLRIQLSFFFPLFFSCWSTNSSSLVCFMKDLINRLSSFLLDVNTSQSMKFHVLGEFHWKIELIFSPIPSSRSIQIKKWNTMPLVSIIEDWTNRLFSSLV